MKEFDVTIIIVAWKVKDILKDCLVSVIKETSEINAEVIIVDNASCDGTVEMVVEDYPEMVIISNLRNRGFARAVNQGIKQARGKHILLLNPDTLITNRAIEKIVKFIDNRDDVGIAGCRILSKDKSIQPSVRKFPTFFNHLVMMFKLHHFFKLSDYWQTNFDYNKEQEVDQVMGAFFLINGKVIEKIGRLDEKYYIWFEEVDYCTRVKKAGFKVVYTPRAEVIHLGGQSFIQTYRIKSQWIYSKSRLRYIKKNQPVIVYLIILVLTPISLLLSLILSLISPKNV